MERKLCFTSDAYNWGWEVDACLKDDSTRPLKVTEKMMVKGPCRLANRSQHHTHIRTNWKNTIRPSGLANGSQRQIHVRTNWQNAEIALQAQQRGSPGAGKQTYLVLELVRWSTCIFPFHQGTVFIGSRGESGERGRIPKTNGFNNPSQPLSGPLGSLQAS